MLIILKLVMSLKNLVLNSIFETSVITWNFLPSLIFPLSGLSVGFLRKLNFFHFLEKIDRENFLLMDEEFNLQLISYHLLKFYSTHFFGKSVFNFFFNIGISISIIGINLFFSNNAFLIARYCLLMLFMGSKLKFLSFL